MNGCFLCDKPFAAGEDIYMYRGDTPFCSVRCREEQIGVDAAEERLRSKQRRKKAMTTTMENKKSSNSSIFSSDEKNMQVFVNAGSVAAAAAS